MIELFYILTFFLFLFGATALFEHFPTLSEKLAKLLNLEDMTN